MYKKKTKGWFKHIDFILLDIIWYQIAFCVAYMIRTGRPMPYAESNYRELLIIAALVDFLVIFGFDSYKNVLKRGYLVELTAVIKQAVFIEMFLMLYMFAMKTSDSYSRITLFLAAGFYIVFSYLIRILWKYILKKYLVAEKKVSMLLITKEELVTEAREEIKNCFGAYYVSGLILPEQDRTGEVINGVPVVASLQNVADYLCKEWVDEVLVVLPYGESIPDTVMEDLLETGVVVHVKISEIEKNVGRKQIVEQFGRYTVVSTGINYITQKQILLKRCMDIFFGLIGCLITGIFCIIIGPMIFISSPGPIFFKQERVGKNGKKFYMYKFRSMYLDAEERKKELLELNRIGDGMMFKLDFDPRVIGNRVLPDGRRKTGIGEFIRITSIDEFPQFFNVLKGDMSLVGTRPPTVDEYNKYKLHHRSRMAFMPGITGLWQISGRSKITDFEEVVKLDRQYIENWSFSLDLKILFRTIGVVVQRKGAM